MAQSNALCGFFVGFVLFVVQRADAVTSAPHHDYSTSYEVLDTVFRAPRHPDSPPRSHHRAGRVAEVSRHLQACRSWTSARHSPTIFHLVNPSPLS